mmetsp:Transcript_8323/g.26496  ORF Transcript_8323/g.26496 Transcript_8323/m.26496 type:complete len:570 (-) Transcript_8323:355-2064(-)
MSPMALLSGAALAISLPLICKCANTMPPPRVALPFGEVRGNALAVVDEFLGLPYAVPPVGALRFAPPEPWSGSYPGGRLAATRRPAACMQRPNAPSLWWDPQEVAMSEDCLYLNIYRPRASGAGGAASRPVMLWIHGGSLLVGTASMPAYNGTELAEREGVLVVAINYRLNVFGFAPTTGAGGVTVANNGWRDQREAMSWVRKHIASFGGDPKRVTLFGESAGGQSILAHVVSPASAGLFSGAISQSGDLSKDYSLAHGLELSGLIARRVGCADAADLHCLRNASAVALSVAMVGVFQQPVVDGDVLPGPPLELVEQGKFNRGVSFVMGANAEDAKVISYPGFSLPSSVGSLLTKAEAQCVFNWTFGKQNGDYLMEAYPPRRSYGVFDNRDLIVELGTDLLFNCPVRSVGHALAAKGAATWVYSFRRIPSCSPLQFPGPVHGAEIAYVFGHQESSAWRNPPLPEPRCRVAPQDRALSRTMMGLWAAFARNGSMPAEWPRWAPGTQPVLKLELSSPCQLATEEGFRAGQCQSLKTAGATASTADRMQLGLVLCQGPRQRRLSGAAPPVFV